MKKSKSLTFKENKREHELYTWTHTIQKKRLSLGLQMYELDIHCSCSIKKIIFICVGREWMHQMISKIHPHPQHCQGPCNPLLETLHSFIHLSILSPINSLHSFIHWNISSQVITRARHCVTCWEHRNYWQTHYRYRVKQACTHNYKMKISFIYNML